MPISLLDTHEYFARLPHQLEAIQILQDKIAARWPELLADQEPWVVKFRGESATRIDPQKAEKIISAVPQDRRAAAATAVPLLLEACVDERVTNPAHLAYILATVSHESAFAPVKEIRANKNTQRALWKAQERYWPSGYYGRGYVQITWRENYQKFSEILGIDLVSNPDLALEPGTAAKICVIGMARGLFTGRRLADFDLYGGAYDFEGARQIVNGLDKAGRISSYARQYLPFCR